LENIKKKSAAPRGMHSNLAHINLGMGKVWVTNINGKFKSLQLQLSSMYLAKVMAITDFEI
jgi:hypothetical protein